MSLHHAKRGENAHPCQHHDDQPVPLRRVEQLVRSVPSPVPQRPDDELMAHNHEHNTAVIHYLFNELQAQITKRMSFVDGMDILTAYSKLIADLDELHHVFTDCVELEMKELTS